MEKHDWIYLGTNPRIQSVRVVWPAYATTAYTTIQVAHAFLQSIVTNIVMKAKECHIPQVSLLCQMEISGYVWLTWGLHCIQMDQFRQKYFILQLQNMSSAHQYQFTA